MSKLARVIGLCLVFSPFGLLWAQGLDVIKQAAEQGEAVSQAKLASLYLLGREGLEVDEKSAADWMRKAADQGLVDAQVVMGALYDRGIGVDADRDTATQWYEKAAAQGHGTSLAILGKNEAAKGSVQFNYQAMRLNAARSIPKEYAKKFLTAK